MEILIFYKLRGLELFRRSLEKMGPLEELYSGVTNFLG